MHVSKLILNNGRVIISLQVRAVLSSSFPSPEATGRRPTLLALIIRRLAESDAATQATGLVKLFFHIGLIVFLTCSFLKFLSLLGSIISMRSLLLVLFNSMVIQFFDVHLLSPSGCLGFLLLFFSPGILSEGCVFLVPLG